MTDIVERRREIERLRAEVEKWKKMDRDAATHVESVICMRSSHFTGNQPDVGWKGLGLALREDYDERERLRAALRDIADGLGETDLAEVGRYAKHIARAALKEEGDE